jgi:GNAT superfamily N-acetyltransferase
MGSLGAGATAHFAALAPAARRPWYGNAMRIALLNDLPDWRSHVPAVERIFFTSSAVQSFTDDAHRARFKARWLGRYLDHVPGSFFVAIAEEGVIGYLAGCLDDPRGNPLFADLGYYAAFGPLCDTYPAHLHINVAAEARSKGVGAALIEAFAAQVAQAKLPGLHLVTDKAARNVRFYEQNGFAVLATTLSHNIPVVFMGRRTAA